MHVAIGLRQENSDLTEIALKVNGEGQITPKTRHF